jgi:hypothetical protein
MPVTHIINHSQIFIDFLNGSNQITVFLFKLVLSLTLGSLNYSIFEKKYRSGTGLRISKMSVTTFAKILMPPFLILIILFKGPESYYWGVEHNERKPLNNLNLTYNCKFFGTDIYKPCFVSDSKSENLVLLVGDSQAMSIVDSFIDASKLLDFDLSVWSGPSCQLNFAKLIGDKSNPCSRQNARILEYIKLNNPKVVFVAQYVDSNSNLLELKESLLQIKNHSDNVILMQNVPIFPDSDKFMVRGAILSKAYSPPKTYWMQEMDNVGNIASDNLAKLVKAEGISVINPKDIFCDSIRCTRYYKKQWLYFDPSHLSLAGSRYLQPLINSYINDLIIR